MNALNSILLEGTIIANEVNETPRGLMLSRIDLVSHRTVENVKETSIFAVLSSGKLAESMAESGKEGVAIHVVGHLKQNTWLDTDQNQQSEVIVIAEHIKIRRGGKVEKDNLSAL